MQNLSFEQVTFLPVTIENNVWLSSPQIGDALGYIKGRISIDKIYKANQDEFTPAMTRLIEMDTAGGKQQTRVFSLRGAHLLGMFARTEKAKAFRKWVLDILDREADNSETKTTKENQVTQDELSQNAIAIERMICNLVPNQVKEVFDLLVKMNHNNMQILAMFTSKKMMNV